MVEHAPKTKKQAEMRDRRGWSSCLSSIIVLKRSRLEVASPAVLCFLPCPPCPTERVSNAKHPPTGQSQCGKSHPLPGMRMSWRFPPQSVLSCGHCAHFQVRQLPAGASLGMSRFLCILFYTNGFVQRAGAIAWSVVIAVSPPRFEPTPHLT
jgi:hypothetical protein